MSDNNFYGFALSFESMAILFRLRADRIRYKGSSGGCGRPSEQEIFYDELFCEYTEIAEDIEAAVKDPAAFKERYDKLLEAQAEVKRQREERERRIEAERVQQARAGVKTNTQPIPRRPRMIHK